MRHNDRILETEFLKVIPERSDPLTSRNMGLKRGQDKEHCIVLGCKHKRKDANEMLRCALCCNWFHHICVDLDPSIPDGVWTCPTCRTISKDVGEIKNTLNIVLGMLTAQTETIVSLKDSLNEKSKECENLIKENLELNKKVHSLVKKNNMSNIQKSLLIGSSIIREVSEDKLVNTDVVCKRGGTN